MSLYQRLQTLWNTSEKHGSFTGSGRYVQLAGGQLYRGNPEFIVSFGDGRGNVYIYPDYVVPAPRVEEITDLLPISA